MIVLGGAFHFADLDTLQLIIQTLEASETSEQTVQTMADQCTVLHAGALRLLAECFPWQPGSHFAYTRDNHNSVLGIREVAADKGALATCVQLGRDGEGTVTLTL